MNKYKPKNGLNQFCNKKFLNIKNDTKNENHSYCHFSTIIEKKSINRSQQSEIIDNRFQENINRTHREGFLRFQRRNLCFAVCIFGEV